MKIIKLTTSFVLFLLCSSLFAFAQDIYDDKTVEKECGVGCKVWQFLFGSKEARAGRAWFDRSDALVGEATGTNTGADKLREEAIKLMNEGNTLREQKKENEAKTKYQEALVKADEALRLQKVPNNYQLKGDVLWNLGQYNKAAQSYNEVLLLPNINNQVKSRAEKDRSEALKAYAGEALADRGGATLSGLIEATQGKDDIAVRKELYEKTFPGETYKTADNADQNIRLLQAIHEGKTTVPFKAGTPAAGSLHDQGVQSQLETSLGAAYPALAKSLGRGKISTFDRPGAGVQVISGSGGEILIDKTAVEGVTTAKYLGKDNKIIERYIIKDGQILATQTRDGNVKVGGTSYNFPKDKILSESVRDLKEGIQLPGKEAPSGLLKLDGDVFTAVNYEKGTMQRSNTKTKESEDLKIDYYKEDTPGCKAKGGCFVPTGGTLSSSDSEGKQQTYLVDYDYKVLTGAERARPENLEDIELFNPRTGKQEGTRLPDGTQVVAQRKFDEKGKEVGYTGVLEVTDADGNKGLITRDEKGNWVPAKDQGVGEIVAAEFLSSEKNKKLADDRHSSTQGALATAQDVVQSIYAVTNNLKSYPAISNLLFGEADFYKKWRRDMDQAFAPLLASNWFPSAICEAAHWNDLEPEGKAVIKTVSGTYQAVASIQMERSPETSPILCHKNPDEESDELFICSAWQVCTDDTFCFADQDRDNEPDSSEPLRGYFYKITWAVSSPQDEALTPLIDENGVAVSFNVFLYPGAVPLYDLNGNIASPIQLQNGASDRDTIIKYSTNVYDQACIRWNQAPRTVTVPGGANVEDVCFNVVTSEVGKVNWERSGQNAASVTVSHGEVSRNTDW